MKRIISLLLALILLLGSVPMNVYATEVEEPITTEESVQETAPQETEDPITTEAPEEEAAPQETEETEWLCEELTVVPEVDLPENDELFAAYVESQLYGYEATTFGTAAGARLSGDIKVLYDALVLMAKKIASGQRASTIIGVGKTVDYQGQTYVADVSATFTSYTLTNADLSLLMDALLCDLPYEMYWYDKTTGVSANYIRSSSSSIITHVRFKFTVADNYYTGDDYTVNTAKASAAATTAAKAKNIVKKYNGKTDYEKLVGYKKELCNLVSYDNEAVTSGNFAYNNDPWQLIHVFDGDSSTNVVCEGYSKAYMYLCDLTTFAGEVVCYTVTGAISGGPHMWNIVTIKGKNYLVDITNSDDGSVGKDGSLFLAGTTNGSPSTGYIIKNAYFTYDIDTKTLWGTDANSILTLADSNYSPSSAPSDPVAPPDAPESPAPPDSAQTTSSGLVYSISGGKVTITDYTGRAKSLTIPATIKGYPVTGIGDDAFADCAELESVTIGNSIKTIGDYAFANCYSLKDITIPGSVKKIGDYAFAYCWELDKIIFGGAAPEFGEECFFDVSATVSYPANSASWANVITKQYGGDITWKKIKPTVTTQPKSKTVSVGSKAQFTVKANGIGIKYQWQYRTSASGNWQNSYATGSKTATITVLAKETNHGYQYRCKITDSYGNGVYTNAAKLTVKPAITTQPVAKAAAVGSNAKFTVAAKGSGLKYQWQYRKSASGSWQNSATAGNNTATITVFVKESNNGYQYRCKITDKYGNVVYTDAAKLTVCPAITTQPKAKAVSVGSSAKFTVAAKGSGLKYQWQYRKSATGSWQNSSATGSKTATITVLAKETNHGYQYRCKVTNSYGNATYTDAAKLTVNPAITTQPKAKTVSVGSSAKFTVAAKGSGLKYQWQYRKSASGSWQNSAATGSKTATLTVITKATNHGYQYRCKITDSYGNGVYTNAAKLTVKPAITTQPVTNSVSVGSKAEFGVAAKGNELSFQWQYRKSATGSWQNSSASGSKTAIMLVTAKTSNNGYQYRCKITDIYGNVVYTNVATLKVK